MKTLRQTLKRNVYGAAAVMFLAAATVPNLVGNSVSAEQITDRSIQMSSSSSGASATYQINFDPVSGTNVEAIVVDFCDSQTGPLVGSACNATGGMTIGTTVDSDNTTATWTPSTLTSGQTLLLTADAATSLPSSVTIDVSGFVNPTDTDSTTGGNQIGTFYARVLTYELATTASGYDSSSPGSNLDDGGVALSTTEDLTVSAAVLETLTFCVQNAENTPTADCGNAPSNPPALTLGTGTPPALSASTVEEENAFFQISTNASGDTSVKMRNGNSSGGLESGSNVIPAVDDTTPQLIAAGTENFGMRVGTPDDTATSGSGASNVNPATEYSSTTSNELNMVLDATQAGNGVDSTYGSALATATGALDSVNVPLTFGAAINATTPAGLYTADFTLIATSSY